MKRKSVTENRAFTLEGYEAKKEDDAFYISGYANTKGKADAYGDVPTNFKDKPVYDLKRFNKNPIALVDHVQSVGNIFGIFTEVEEDEKGLRIKLRLMENPKTPNAQHAVEAYKSGYARAFSIGGIWKHEDDENPTHLTKAIIHEISGVAIGADQHALSRTQKPKSMDEAAKAHKLEVVEFLVATYRKEQKAEILETIKTIQETQS